MTRKWNKSLNLFKQKEAKCSMFDN